MGGGSTVRFSKPDPSSVGRSPSGVSRGEGAVGRTDAEDLYTQDSLGGTLRILTYGAYNLAASIATHIITLWNWRCTDNLTRR